MKKAILKILGHLGIINYCPKHGWMSPRGWYKEKYYCKKCK